MIKSISILSFIFLVFFIIGKLWSKNPLELLRDYLDKGVSKVGNVNYNVHRRNVQKGAVSKKKTFIDSPYYKLCQEILSDLGLGRVTVEAFTFTLAFLDIAINIGIYSLTKAVFLYFTGLVVVYIAMLAGLYMMASVGHYNKLFAVMDAEDLIISTIDRGVTVSVRLNIDNFSPIIVDYFIEFLSNMDEYNLSFSDSMNILNRQLGDKFTDFAGKAIQLENNQRAGSIEVFSDTILINSDLRIDTMEMMQFLKETNTSFALSILVLVGFTIMFFGTAKGLTTILLTTKTGQLLLSINLALVILGFARLQSLRRDIKVRGDV